MADDTPRQRKRSRVAGFTAIGALGMLAGCDAGPSEEELSRAQFGEPQEVAAYRSVSECVADGEYSEEQCQVADRNAWNQDSTAAPRFEDQIDCEDQFGFGNCRSQGSFFVPAMTGFLIGRYISGGSSRYRYAGLYRDSRDDVDYMGSGGWLYRGKSSKSNRYYVGAKALDPVTSPRVQTRSAIASRGGFGGRAGMSGGG
jgi:uncharacterized protein YgiB involved in biofilm formation